MEKNVDARKRNLAQAEIENFRKLWSDPTASSESVSQVTGLSVDELSYLLGDKPSYS